MKAACPDEAIQNTSAVVGRASLTTRIRAQDVIDSYQISQARLKLQYPRWSTINLDVQITAPDTSVANRIRTLASENNYQGCP